MICEVKYYIIDDDKPILSSLEKLIMKVFPNSKVNAYESGIEAWQYLQNEADSSVVVICDLNMPGMNGMQLLKKIRAEENLKHIYFMMITASLDTENNIKALQQGADDFISKPFSIDHLISKLRSASRLLSELCEKKQLEHKISEFEIVLKEDKDKYISALKTLQNVRLPEFTKSLKRIVEASYYIAEQLCDTRNEVNAAEEAANLCYLGRLFLPEKLMYQPVMVKGMTPSKIMLGVPEFSREILSKVRDCKECEEVLYHVNENFDGSGFPDGLKGWKIPIGSRILKVVLDFEELMKKNADNPAKVIDLLWVEAKRLYDFKVIAFYDQYLASKECAVLLGKKGREEVVKIRELEENMIISRHVITESGLIMIAAGTSLNEEKIFRIQSINKTDNVLGKIFIRTR